MSNKYLSWPVPAGHFLITFKDPDWTGGGDDDYSGHGGTDMGFHYDPTISPNGNDWTDMVSNPKSVTAAQSGTIIRLDFSQPDQCDVRLSSGDHAPGGSKCSSQTNYVVIDHGTTGLGYRYTNYVHLQQNNVANLVVGQTVSAGDLIGYVGSSGNSTNPHLHFEVGTGPGSGSYLTGIVDPFYSPTSASPRGSNTTSSLWADQDNLPIFNTNTPSGDVPPTIGTTTTSTTTTTALPPPLLGGSGSGGGSSPGFECITSKGVNVTKKFLGQGLNYQDTIVTSLEIFFTGDGTLSDWKNYISTYRASGTRTASLTIGSITFTNASITSFDATSSPDGMNNAIDKGTINLQIEEIVEGDLSNINTTEYSDLYGQINSYNEYIQDISESFSYTSGLNNQNDIVHSITVVPNDIATQANSGNPTALTGAIAKAIVDNYQSSSSNLGSIQSTLRTAGVEGYVSTSENKITGEYTYTRRINTLSNRDSSEDSTYEYTHNLSLNKEGVITVTESGKILSINKAINGNLNAAIAELSTILSSSAGRCSTVYTNAVLTSSGTLNTTTPIETRKNINHINQEVSYTIIYTDDPNIGTNYTTERELIVSQNESGITELTERGNFTIYGSKGNTNVTPQSVYSTESSGALTRLNSLLGSSGLNTNSSIYETNSEVSYNPNGKNLTYTKTFNTDKNRDPSAGIKKITKVISDKLPIRTKTEFPIAAWKMLVHDPANLSGTGGGKQSRLGERTVTVTCVLDRSTLGANFLSSPSKPTNMIAYAATVAESELNNVFTDLNFSQQEKMITDFNYEITSDRNLTVTATIQYPQEI